MKKSNLVARTYVFAGVVLLALVIVVGIAVMIPSRTIDFSGTVSSVIFDEESGYTYVTAIGEFDGPTIEITIKKGTSVKYSSGDKFDIQNLKEGDTILLDYKSKLQNGENKVIAKWVQVLPK